ncbi:hypothetical protein F2Q68_00035040 [Brassica cretica]|uniref:Uncharacterized protein n=1 Tax=Brassica cretica TaxID=69181 RepID=A0A8S9H1V1_BRACR|nr:hypothetical protein F2Q68_00035040 [Brassica cretica]
MASSLSTPVVASASSRLWHPASNGKISVPSASLSLRTGSRRSFSIAFDLSIGTNGQKRRGLVVRAGKAALCQTKRSKKVTG